MSKVEKNNVSEIAGIAFVGCVIVGTGLGLLMDNVSVGSVLGVGVGFLVMALVRATKK